MESKNTEVKPKSSGEDGKSEEELIEKAKSGNYEAFDQLILRYQDRIYSTVFRMTGNREDSLDVSQDAFIKAFKSLERFRENSSFYTWLYRIAVNTAISFMRKRKKKNHISLESMTYGDDDEKQVEKEDKSQVTPSTRMEKGDLQSQVQDAVMEIQEEYRTALILKDYEGLSYDEISEVLEIPKGTVKSRIYRAREALREKLKDLMS